MAAATAADDAADAAAADLPTPSEDDMEEQRNRKVEMAKAVATAKAAVTDYIATKFTAAMAVEATKNAGEALLNKINITKDATKKAQLEGEAIEAENRYKAAVQTYSRTPKPDELKTLEAAVVTTVSAYSAADYKFLLMQRVVAVAEDPKRIARRDMLKRVIGLSAENLTAMITAHDTQFRKTVPGENHKVQILRQATLRVELQVMKEVLARFTAGVGGATT